LAGLLSNFCASWLQKHYRRGQMRTFLLILACFARHGHARRVQNDIDDQDNYHAIAGLLLNTPSLSTVALRTTGPRMQWSERSPAVSAWGTSTGWGMGQDQMAGKIVPREEFRQGRVIPREEFQEGRVVPSRGGFDPDTVMVQGNTLKTWAFKSVAVERVQVQLTTQGRPLDADIELWQGPDNIPVKMRVYSEDGLYRPVSVICETGRSPSTVAIRNVGQMEFPLGARVIANDVEEPVHEFDDTSMIVQGSGALKTFHFDGTVGSVEIVMKTDGRPLNARIELLQGPSNNKQVMEVYSEDGVDRPFFTIIETPGPGCVIRLANSGPMAFPLYASVQPHTIDDDPIFFEPVISDR
jgi:hypothetical protein